MNKSYKGWELIKAASEGEFTEGQKFIIDGFNDESEVIYRNDCFYIDGIEELSASFIIGNDNTFVINNDINIQTLAENHSYNLSRETNQDNINTLIKVVKQLDQRLKKIEEDF